MLVACPSGWLIWPKLPTSVYREQSANAEAFRFPVTRAGRRWNKGAAKSVHRNGVSELAQRVVLGSDALRESPLTLERALPGAAGPSNRDLATIQSHMPDGSNTSALLLGVAQKYLRTIETKYPSRFVLHSDDRSLKSPYWRPTRM